MNVIDASDGEDHTLVRGSPRSHGQAGVAFGNGVGIQSESNVGRVRHRPDTLVLVVVSHRRTGNKTLTILFRNGVRRVEVSRHTIHQASHRHRVHLNVTITLGGEVLVQTGASLARSVQSSDRGVIRTNVVVGGLRRVLKVVRFNGGHEDRSSRLNVTLGESRNFRRAIGIKGQFSRVEAHIHTRLRTEGDGLGGFVLILNVHDTRTFADGVLVRAANTQDGTDLCSRLGVGRVVLTVGGCDELRFFMGDGKGFPCDHVDELQGVTHVVLLV